jgi:hypothetical protein
MLLWVAGSAVAAPVLTSERAGNLFAAGEPVRFTVGQASGAVRWEIRDWKDQTVASGTLAEGGAAGPLQVPALPPGYYELSCADVAGATVAALGVVMERGAGPLDSAGRIGVDVAASWCVEAEQRPAVVRMIRLAGIPWVRERLGWADVEREAGTFKWGVYDEVATLWQAAGVSVSQVVDFAPWWANGGSPNPPPRELTAVYRLFREASRHFAGRIQAWEAWNEVDCGWPTTADAYAGVFKAAALGVHDGDPGALVLPASLSAHQKLPYHENLARCGLADYYDVLNIHRYHDPYGQLPTVRELTRMFGPKPVWLTETNELHWLDQGRGDGTVLFRGEQQRGARYLPKVAALALAAGIQRLFIFMLPHRIEGQVQFGLLRPDLTPYPEFVALSAAANILGRGTYVGRLPLPDGADARLFNTPTGPVVIAWAGQPTLIPVRGTEVRVLDLFGAERTAEFPVTAAGITIAGDPVYLVGADLEPLRPLLERAPAVTEAKRRSPSRVIMTAECALPIAKRHNWYLIPAAIPLDYRVQVWNLDEKQPAETEVHLHLPKGWTAERTHAAVTVLPLASQSLTFKLTPAVAVLGPEELRVEGACGGRALAPLASWFGRDPAAVPPARTQDLVGAWEIEAPAAGQPATVALERLRPGVVRITTLPSAPEKRTVTLKLALRRGCRLDKSAGVRVLVEPAAVEATFSLRLIDAGGATWTAGASDGDVPGARLFLFRDLDWYWPGVPAFVPGLRGAREIVLICDFVKPVESCTLEIQAVQYTH